MLKIIKQILKNKFAEYVHEDETEYNAAIKELDEEYAEGYNFGVDGFMYAHCYNVYPKGEMPEW